MPHTLPNGVVELNAQEWTTIDGGSPLPIVRYLAGCFSAGFAFGYNELGPALFG